MNLGAVFLLCCMSFVGGCIIGGAMVVVDALRYSEAVRQETEALKNGEQLRVDAEVARKQNRELIARLSGPLSVKRGDL